MAAQMNAYLQVRLWQRNAAHANDMAEALATALASIPGVEIQQPPEANILFCLLPMPLIRGLLDTGWLLPRPPGARHRAVGDLVLDHGGGCH
jgi:threonine aldolase